jgi:hypothetical protein
MTRIELEIHDDVISTINKIKSINDPGIELIIPEGSVLFDNILNLKLIDTYMDRNGKSVQFSSNDEKGNSLIAMLEGKAETVFSPEEMPKEEKVVPTQKRNILPKLSLALPKIKIPFKPLVVIPVILLALLALLLGLSRTQKAVAKIVLNNLTLTRSITLKVKAGAETNVSSSLLKGVTAETTLTGDLEAPTTGSILEGDKAEGKVTLYNKTDTEVVLKKGTVLTYSNNDKDYRFVLDSEITIPASHEQDSSSPGSPIIPGEKDGNVTADSIGKDYNLSKGKSLEVAKYKTSSLEAESKESFSGGKSETVKAVSQGDIDTLSKNLLEQAKGQAEMALKSSLPVGNKLIPGSFKLTVKQEVLSNKLGEKTDKLKLTQEVQVSGLAYSQKELDTLLGETIHKLVPEGYVLSKNDWTTTIETLGNSISSVLSNVEADLQVTLKTSMIPQVDKEGIKKALAGKTAAEALKYLGSIKNIKNYELKITPALPFFRKVPQNLDKIDLTVENE